MNAADLLTALSTDASTLVLSPSAPVLGAAGRSLRSALNATQRLRLTETVKDTASTDSLLIVKGNTRLLGRDFTGCRAVFRLSRGKVMNFYVLAPLPQDWTLAAAAPGGAIPGPASSLAKAVLKSGCLVVACGTPVVSEPAFGLNDEVLGDGLRLCAAGLSSGFTAGEVSLPADFAAVCAKNPAALRGRVALHGDTPWAQFDLWWDATKVTVGQTTPLRVGLRVECAAKTSAVTLLADLPLGEADVLTVSSRPAAVPFFRADVSPPQRLSALSDVFALGGVTADGPSLMADFALPAVKKNAPLWAVTDLSLTDTVLQAQVGMVDAGGAPFRWSPVKGIVELRDPSLSIRLETSGEAAAEMVFAARAHFDIAQGLDFDVLYAPGVSISGVLARPAAIPATEVIDSIFGPTGLPDFRVTLREASVRYSIPDKSTRFTLGLDGEVNLLGDHALVLRNPAMTVERPGKGAVTGSLSGEILIGEVPVRVSAERDADKHWSFQSVVSPDRPIPLASLADQLLHEFGTAIPQAALDVLPGIALGGLCTRFDTGTREFSIEADIDWTMPPALKDLPWSGWTAASSHFSLVTARDPQSGKRGTEVALDWICTKDGNVFEAAATFGPEESFFRISWAGATEKETLGLKTLLDLLQAQHALGGVEEWGIFNYRCFALEYDRKSRALSIAAESSLAGGVFDIQAVIGKHPGIRLSWQASSPGVKLGIGDAFKALGGLPLPANDLLGSSIGQAFADIFSFTALSVQYSHKPQPTLLFTAVSACSGYKEAMIVAMKGRDGKWGIAFGVVFAGKSVAQLLNLENTAVVSELLGMLVPKFLFISTVDQFTLPAGSSAAQTVETSAVTPPPFVDGNGAKSTPFGASKLRLHKGVTVAGTIDFTKTSIGQVLNRQFGWTTLDGRICAGPAEVEIEAVIPGKFSLPTGREFALSLQDARVAMLAGKGVVGAAIRGVCDVRLFDVHHEYDFQLGVTNEGLDMKLHVDGTPALPSLAAFPGVSWVGPYWIDLGIAFEPAGFRMGMDAEFHIGPDKEKYKGKAVIILVMEGPVPNPVYIDFSISRLDLWAMFEAQFGIATRMQQAKTAANQLGDGTPMEEGLAWVQAHYENLQSIAGIIRLEDAGFHWAETAVTLPDGSIAAPGTAFHGTLNIAGWRAFGMFEFTSSPPALTAQLDLSPLHLSHVLSITGDGKGVRKDGKYLIEPGGATLHIDSGKPPFLHGRLHVTLFELLHADVSADVTDEGFRFELSAAAGDIIGLTLGCSLRTKDGFRFDAHGSFGLHLDVHLGPIIPGLAFTEIHLNAGLDAHIEILLTGEDFRVTVGGSFEFEGASLTLPDLTLTTPFGSLAELPGKILAHLRDKAGEIFADIWNGITHAVEEAAKAVAAVAVAAVEEVKQIGEAAARTAAVVGKALAEEAGKIGSELKDAAVAVGKEAAQIATAAVDAVASVTSAALDKAKEIAGEAARVLDAAVQAAARVAEEVAREVTLIAAEIAHAFEAMEHEIAEIAQAAVRAVKQLLEDARALAEAIAHEAEEIVRGIEHAISAVWDEINALISRAAEALRNAASAVGNGIANFVTTGSC